MNVRKARKGQIHRHDAKYECKITMPKNPILKSVTHTFGGQICWALVPEKNFFVRKMVVVLEDPVDYFVIENFSTPPKHERSTRTHRTKS